MPTIRTRSAAVLGGTAVLAAGSACLLAGVVLMVLIARAQVAGGHPDTLKALVYITSAALELPLAALMLARAPRHPIGWMLCAAGLGGSAAFAAAEYAAYSYYVEPLPGASWAGWFSRWVAMSFVLLPAVALLLFPTGRLLSPRWRPFLWCGVASWLLLAASKALGPGEDLATRGNPLLADATSRALAEPLEGVGWLLLYPATIAGIVALIRRRRAADGEVQEQLRLMFGAAVFVAAGFVACGIGSFLAPRAFDIGAAAAITSLSVLAATMAVAILRHRLYGLDVYVNRALVLTGLTIVLGGLYVAAVLAVSRLLGQDVQLGVALPATALVAVAFHPVRDQLQRRVNRLLHGQRDEPYAAISTLGRRLGEAMAPTDVLPVMVDTIADALRLPYVAVELADAPGVAAAEHGIAAAGIALRLPLIHAGERVGTLVIGARAHGEYLSDADRRLLEDFARRASTAASAVALSLEVQRSREQLVVAREEERRRLRGDLHDGLGPTLAGAVLTIDAARRMLATDPHAADTLLDQAAASVESTVADVRRLVYGLRPPALDQLGIVGALRQQATTLSLGSTPLACEIRAPDPMPLLPAAVEVAAFRIAQEALTNIARHAGARHADVTIAIDGALHLEVRDDGQGIPPDTLSGVGLTSMRERATELGGRFEIAGHPGGGTLIRVQLPLTPAIGDAPGQRA